MKFAIILSLAAAAFVAANPVPATVEKRLTCQACSVGPLNAGPACCSAHCLAQGHWHGGHCDSKDYCICN
ncbi:hypothetical protein GQ53DRAFT_824933 [Thozetella sp. PMI_491]|nr:hypothetical protein GQ53DRAFT_824933 [Thozetella sp. PMI_491]